MHTFKAKSIQNGTAADGREGLDEIEHDNGGTNFAVVLSDFFFPFASTHINFLGAGMEEELEFAVVHQRQVLHIYSCKQSQAKFDRT